MRRSARACGVDDEDLGDMIAEIRRLDPKPGRAFGAPIEPPAIPDVFVTAAPDNSWRVELNSEALPRVLVNETYVARINAQAARARRTGNISRPHLQTANWLTKSLEQRARTILNVATEIVRRQDGFFVERRGGACGRSISRPSPMRSACTNPPSRARPRTSTSRRRAACSR